MEVTTYPVLVAMLFLMVGLVLGGGLLFLWVKASARWVGRVAFEQQLEEEGQRQFDDGQRQGQAALRESLELSQQQLAVSQAQLAMSHQTSGEQGARIETLQAQVQQQLGDLASVQARMQEMQVSFAAREKLLNETNVRMKTEFESLANQVFEAQGVRQKESLNHLLNPFKDQIVDFRKRVEEVYRTDTKDRSSLLNEVQNLQKASARINDEAENLTKALKGDNKVQGNWGELVLERILEDCGLRKDHEYQVQPSERDQDGQLKRPDVIVRLPDGKDVVVDSKVNLVAYENALTSEEEGLRASYLQQHIAALRSQVKKLSAQDYDQLPGVRSLDFVLLFVPIESAFSLAMEAEPRLFTDAFNKRIMLVSPTTLMMALRIIENLWKVEKQNRNAQDIAQRAGALYDKLYGVVEDVDKLGKQLTTARGTFDNMYARLATGKGNLVSQAEKFRALGAPVKRAIAPQLAAQVDGQPDEESDLLIEAPASDNTS